MTLWTKLFGVKCPYFHSVDKGVALTDVLRMNLKEKKKQKKRSVKISPTAVWMINSIFFFRCHLDFCEFECSHWILVASISNLREQQVALFYSQWDRTALLLWHQKDEQVTSLPLLRNELILSWRYFLLRCTAVSVTLSALLGFWIRSREKNKEDQCYVIGLGFWHLDKLELHTDTIPFPHPSPPPPAPSEQY